jgi:hypothetical protein
MAEGFVHTVFKDDEWINEVEGGSPFGVAYATKESAVKVGRQRAREARTEHLIHNRDGTIGERYSYGNDPASRPG